MNNPLTFNDVTILIDKAQSSFRQEECSTCECYLGYIAQLELDGDQGIQEYLAEIKPSKDEIHACLGCDPCSPGILYSDYLRKKSDQLP